MMKRAIALGLTAAMMIGSALGLTGCSQNGSEDSQKKAVCFVIQNTANSQGINLNTVKNDIPGIIRNEGFTAVISCDGNPSVEIADAHKIPDNRRNAATAKLDKDAAENAISLAVKMQNTVADDNEVDCLKSLQLAVRTLSSLNGYDSKEIVFIGTGLSTTGSLDFTKNWLLAESNDVVEMLENQKEIPDFSTIKVTFQQLGDTSAPQKPLPQALKENLKSIYAGIVEAGNGTVFFDDTLPNAVNADVSYPSVTTVEIPSNEIKVYQPTKTSDKSSVPQKCDSSTAIKISEKTLPFVPDKSTYLYPDKANEVLKPLANIINRNKRKVLLCGTTAGDTNDDFSISLSEQRAETVRNTLVKLGVDKKYIAVIGLGSTNPWHIYGLGLGKEATVNRSVVLIDASSETAQNILKNNKE